MLATAMSVSGMSMGIDMGSGKGMMLRTLMLASDMGKDSKVTPLTSNRSMASEVALLISSRSMVPGGTSLTSGERSREEAALSALGENSGESFKEEATLLTSG